MSRFLQACFLLCLPTLVHAVECEDARRELTVERAMFASGIADREPVGQPRADTGRLDALWFFSEIRGAAGHVLHHQWFWRDERVTDVPLAIGGDRWRTWSSKVLGRREASGWRVDLRLDNGCLLGSYRFADDASPRGAEENVVGADHPGTEAGARGSTTGSTRPDAASATAARAAADIRALIAAGDTTGARLALAKHDGDGSLSPDVAERLALEVALARMTAQVEADELYLVGARLDQFLGGAALPAELRHEAEALRTRLQARRRQLNERVAGVLATWERVRAETMAGLVCADDEETLRTALAIVPDSEYLMINAPQRRTDSVTADLLDRRTGLMHRVTQRCVRGW